MWFCPVSSPGWANQMLLINDSLPSLWLGFQPFWILKSYTPVKLKVATEGNASFLPYNTENTKLPLSSPPKIKPNTPLHRDNMATYNANSYTKSKKKAHILRFINMEIRQLIVLQYNKTLGLSYTEQKYVNQCSLYSQGFDPGYNFMWEINM